MKHEEVVRAEEILNQLAQLLFAENASSVWGRKLYNLASKKTLHVADFKNQIRGLYGGMGSLNDIVLMGLDGKVDREANGKFEALKDELFRIVTTE